MASHNHSNGREKSGSRSERVLGSIELYYRDIRDVPILTNEQELVHFLRWKNGDRSAGNELVRSNLRLVADIALNYGDQGLPFEDLVQEGNLGLYEALEHFDPSHKTRFSSFAYFWVERFMLTALSDQSKIIVIPAWAKGLPERWNRARRELLEEGREITDEAIARSIGYTGNFDQVTMTMRGAARERDAEAHVYREASEMDGVRQPDAIVIEREQNYLRRAYLTRLMDKTLTSCEKQYVFAAFGFDDYREKSGPVLARMFDRDTSTINSHKRRALDKLRKALLEGSEVSGERIPDSIVRQIL